MLSQQDKERLVKAQQSVDVAHKSIVDLYKAENQLLAEHGFDMMETLAKMNQKLLRLLVVTK